MELNYIRWASHGMWPQPEPQNSQKSVILSKLCSITIPLSWQGCRLLPEGCQIPLSRVFPALPLRQYRRWCIHLPSEVKKPIGLNTFLKSSSASFSQARNANVRARKTLGRCRWEREGNSTCSDVPRSYCVSSRATTSLQEALYS